MDKFTLRENSLEHKSHLILHKEPWTILICSCKFLIFLNSFSHASHLYFWILSFVQMSDCLSFNLQVSESLDEYQFLMVMGCFYKNKKKYTSSSANQDIQVTSIQITIKHQSNCWSSLKTFSVWKVEIDPKIWYTFFGPYIDILAQSTLPMLRFIRVIS